MKLSTLFATAALACAVTAPAFAQSLGGGAVQAQFEHSMRASKLVGMTVHNEQNQTIGSIVEILVNDQTGMATAVLSVGDYVGGGKKMVEVPVTHLKLDAGKAMMPATKQTLAAMPNYNAGWFGGN